jgi:hypothetical protein
MSGIDGNQVVADARQLYVQQLVAFLRNRFAKDPAGAAEVPTERTGNPNLYGNHYRIDFVTTTKGKLDGSVVVELVPDRQMVIDPIEGTAGPTRIRLERVSWDDVEILHDAPGDMAALLGAWFTHWYDPDDKRTPSPGEPPPGVIHSLGIYPDALAIDFGTAPVDAFWSLITLLRDAGAKKLTVRATRELPPSR